MIADIVYLPTVTFQVKYNFQDRSSAHIYGVFYAADFIFETDRRTVCIDSK